MVFLCSAVITVFMYGGILSMKALGKTLNKLTSVIPQPSRWKNRYSSVADLDESTTIIQEE